MPTRREEFLAGDRPEDVQIFLHDAVISNPDALLEYGERTDVGLVLVLPGDEASGLFESATGIDPMSFARTAMDTDGSISRDCAGGTCPDCGSEQPRFVFAFAEEQNEEVGDMYAEGAVMHGYAACECGQQYSEKWVIDAD